MQTGLHFAGVSNAAREALTQRCQTAARQHSGLSRDVRISVTARPDAAGYPLPSP
jgi:hypothetical protein